MTRPDVRVALVTPRYPPAAGDIARGAYGLANQLAGHGVDVVVFCGVYRGFVPTTGTETTERESPRVYRPSTVYEALALLDLEESERPFDLLHLFSLPSALTCSRMLRRCDWPIVVTLVEEDGTGHRTELEALEPASWVAAVNSSVMRRVAAAHDLSGRSSVIMPGFDPATRVAWQPTTENAGVIGMTIDPRRPETFRWAMDACRRVPPGVVRRLEMIEEPPERDAVESEDEQQMRCACALAPDLEIRATLPDTPDDPWYRGLGVFVVPYLHPGALHAMRCAAAAGVPIVAVDVHGVRDILTDDTRSWLVPPGDAARLAEAIERLATTPGLSLELSREARRAVSGLTPTAECERYLDVYARLLSRAGVMSVAGGARR
jgi:glycosyltransferase involved in cell wall biosynthesis